jgi:RND family efflux transporter MFP subunit
MRYSTYRARATSPALAGALLLAAACGPREHRETAAAPPRVAGTVVAARDTALPTTFDAAGVAAPVRQATLGTKLMGTVTAVLVEEGDAVVAGQPLVRIDARDLAAKSAQVAASVAEAEAVRRDALAQATRIRSLHADSAATRAQLDAVETGLSRADAGVRAARAAAGELGAVRSYATIRAPFAGIVTRRFVDPGAFAAPGAPLVSVQDATTLRVSASAAPDVVGGLRRGRPIAAAVEGQPVTATVEGVVPAASGHLYTVNALVPNPARAMLAGSAATLALPLGIRRALVVPAAAVTREGDLAGVTLRTADGDERRWVRLGRVVGGAVEVNAGLRAGDRVVVPAASAARASTSIAAAPRRDGRS